jgi:hypothetical protein
MKPTLSHETDNNIKREVRTPDLSIDDRLHVGWLVNFFIIKLGYDERFKETIIRISDLKS